MPETPKEKLKKMTAWDIAPALTDAEIDELLAQSALMDTDGLSPLSEDWTPTYNINRAAATGWLIKAGRATELVEVDPGSGQFTSKVFENCLAMARIYKSKSPNSVRLPPLSAEE